MKSRTKIKICGLTKFDDAGYASELEVDYLGMVFYEKSRRICSLEEAKKIMRDFKNQRKVLVFGQDSMEYVLGITKNFRDGSFLIQIPFDHRNISELTQSLSHENIIVSYPMTGKTSDQDLSQFKEYAEIILDTGGIKNLSGGDMLGGTGKTFNWDFASSINQGYFLAGGLSEKNIQGALRKLNPNGVDVSSGIEKKIGIKDHIKMKNFVSIVKTA